MKVHCIRTAMIGGGLSYDVYVPIKQMSNYDGSRYTTIHRDGGVYVDYVQATLPEDHFAMELGWDRYDAFLAHQRKAKVEMLDIAERAFPELAKYRATGNDAIPLLWVCGLLYPKEETSKDVVLEA